MNFYKNDKSVFITDTLSSTNTQQILQFSTGCVATITYSIPTGLTALIDTTIDDPFSLSARWVNVISSTAGDDTTRKVSVSLCQGIRIRRGSGTGSVVLITSATNVVDDSVVSSLLTLRGWYKADAITGLTDGSLVSTWNDSSGNGNNVTSSGALRPTYYNTTAAQLQNGLPTISFNGSNALAVTTGMSGQPCTVFVIGKTTVDLTNQYFVDGLVTNSMVVTRLNGLVQAYAGSLLAGPALANNTYTVMCAVFNGASSIIRSQATEVSGAVGAASNAGLTIGNAAGASVGVGLNGNIGEVIVASGSYSLAVRDQICSYLLTKWNIN